MHFPYFFTNNEQAHQTKHQPPLSTLLISYDNNYIMLHCRMYASIHLSNWFMISYINNDFWGQHLPKSTSLSQFSELALTPSHTQIYIHMNYFPVLQLWVSPIGTHQKVMMTMTTLTANHTPLWHPTTTMAIFKPLSTSQVSTASKLGDCCSKNASSITQFVLRPTRISWVDPFNTVIDIPANNDECNPHQHCTLYAPGEVHLFSHPCHIGAIAMMKSSITCLSLMQLPTHANTCNNNGQWSWWRLHQTFLHQKQPPYNNLLTPTFLIQSPTQRVYPLRHNGWSIWWATPSPQCWPTAIEFQ